MCGAQCWNWGVWSGVLGVGLRLGSGAMGRCEVLQEGGWALPMSCALPGR